MSSQKMSPTSGSLNYMAVVLDEIALEGLDGITFPALEARLRASKRMTLLSNAATGATSSAKLRDLCWAVARANPDVQVFKLKAPRKKLVIYDRYQYVDPELGIVIDPDDLEDIYTFHLISQEVNGEEIKGSCSTFHTRADVTAKAKALNGGVAELISTLSASGHEEGLVLVASQALRGRSLLGRGQALSVADPILAKALSPMQWAILERVGRARHAGEPTHGKMSLQVTKETPKALFYQRKLLLREKLLKKQNFYSRAGSFICRAFTKRSARAQTLVQSLIVYLRSRPPLCMATYDEVREATEVGAALKKIVKHITFQRYIKADANVPFRTLYPDAPESQWRVKSKQRTKEDGTLEYKEKTLRVIQLRDPNCDPDVVWAEGKEESDDEDEDDAKDDVGLLDQSRWLLDRSMMSQAYSLLEAAGVKGLTQTEIGKLLGLSKLDARTVCRNFERKGLASAIMFDHGRQRTAHFVAKRWEHLCKASQQLKQEQLKLEELQEQHDETNATDGDVSMVESVPDKDITLGSAEDDENPTEHVIEDGNVQVTIADWTHATAGCKKLERPEKKDADETASLSGKAETPSSLLSLRQLKRSNLILEAVRAHKLIDDPSKLLRYIHEEEAKEGITTKMDKHSLLRILVVLRDMRKLNNFIVKIRSGSHVKKVHLISEPHISKDHSIIVSAIDQAKMKFNFRPKIKEEVPPVISDSIDESVKLAHDVLGSLDDPANKQTNSPSKSSRVKRYGVQPRYIRMRELHLFLFYLTRGYNGDVSLKKEEAVAAICAKPDLDDATFKKEIDPMDIYSTDISWKMFIPPLPNHQGWTSGWCLMCDVIMRLPLSTFVKLVNITYDVPELNNYLAHPVRQHFLIRHLPTEMRANLLQSRKYVFSIHEVATRLAFIGAIQFGPQKFKEKDRVFLFVNERGSLIDTAKCTPSINRLPREEVDRMPVKRYHFKSIQDVEKYWYEIWDICLTTPLRTVVEDEDGIEKSEKKPILLAVLEPKESQEASKYDLGEIPGDHLGAAGMDSSLFAHLRRNWFWHGRKSLPMCTVPKKPGAPTTTMKAEDAEDAAKAQRAKQLKRRLTSVYKSQGMTEGPDLGDPVLRLTPFPKRARRRTAAAKAKNKDETAAVSKKPYYDDKDKAALRLMRKLRVDWSPAEDSFLLLCRVAGNFVCRRHHLSVHTMVPYAIVRDLLHKHFPEESCNKTSRACQRRINYMMKNAATAHSVKLFFAEVEQDREIFERFPMAEEKPEGREENEDKIQQDFEPLVEMLLDKYKKGDGNSGRRIRLPNTTAEIRQKFEIRFPTFDEDDQGETEPQTTEDIQESVLRAVIISSLCTSSDKTNWAYHLFKVYQQYPDHILRSAMNNLRTSKMISLNKSFNRNMVKRSNMVPLSSAPYQLSVSFAHKLLSRYQYDIYGEAWAMFKQLISNSSNDINTELVLTQEGGFAACVLGLLSTNRLTLRTEVPDQLVVLDPNVSLVDEQYVKLLQRYKELLRSSGRVDEKDLAILNSAEEARQSDVTSSSAKAVRNQVTTSALFRPGEDKKGGELGRSAKKRNLATAAEPTQPTKRARRDGDDEIVFGENDASEESSSGDQSSITDKADHHSSHQVAKSASRIALYMMREEIKDGSANSAIEGMSVQHSHDFFVISSCKVSAFLKQQGEGGTPQSVKFGTFVAPPGYMDAGSVETGTKILNSFGVNYDGMSNRSTEKLRRTCLPTDDYPKIDDVIGSLGLSKAESSKARSLYAFIVDSKESGVRGQDLRYMAAVKPAARSEADVVRILGHFLDSRLVLRVGVTYARFVAIEWASAWITHSHKMTRTKTKEKLPDIKFAGKLMDPSDGKDVTVAKGKSVCAGTAVSEAAERVSWPNVEKADLLIRPWIRIDGSLNRRVLDRLLGAVLGHIMQRPGQTLEQLGVRLSPALQPTHSRELVELLEELGCVAMQRLRQSGRPGLFSKATVVSLEKASILDESDQVVTEANADAIVKLAQFVGEKQYAVDFVCQCTCHPDNVRA